MTTLRIVHLVDDTTPGGVMRMLDHLLTLPELHGHARQTVRVVSKTALSLGRQNADVIVSHLALSWRTLPAVMSLRALNPGARLLHTEHSYTRAFTALNVRHKARFYTMLRTSYALFDGVISVSRGQADWLLQRGLVRNDALSVLRPQVDLSEFGGLEAPDPGGRVVGAFGRLERQKGFDVLIEAFRLVRGDDVRLVIFGQGGERPVLEKLAQGDPRISFRGHCGDPAAALGETHIVAMPSRWEAFGIVAQEAQAARRRVLASDVDGLADQESPLIRLEKTLSPEAWAHRLQLLLDAEPSGADTGSGSSFTGHRAEYAAQWLQQFRPEQPATDISAAKAA
ncbi:glycosyltransferase family 4 protein [Roseobacter sp. S98]|uniref:glycosyltransferase family 4 protein n=1 Tax=Roseobacter algicola (ex Choi et al. 2025) (nom. illeg.) TaxID=3092138 RepID=UPI003F514047